MDTLFTRVAGLDRHQKTVVACVRITGPDGKPVEQIRTFGTMTVDLLALSDWLVEQRVTHIAMESTGVLWKPVWTILDGRSEWELMLVNPRELRSAVSPAVRATRQETSLDCGGSCAVAGDLPFAERPSTQLPRPGSELL
jgi:hypothetical protein